MANSIRQLFTDMDDCATVLSLKRLGEIHRRGVDGDYYTGPLEQPVRLSLKGLYFRHKKTLKFLWLNTFLMPTIEFDALVATKVINEAAPDRMPRSQEMKPEESDYLSPSPSPAVGGIKDDFLS